MSISSIKSDSVNKATDIQLHSHREVRSDGGRVGDEAGRGALVVVELRRLVVSVRDVDPDEGV